MTSFIKTVDFHNAFMTLYSESFLKSVTLLIYIIQGSRSAGRNFNLKLFYAFLGQIKVDVMVKTHFINKFVIE